MDDANRVIGAKERDKAAERGEVGAAMPPPVAIAILPRRARSARGVRHARGTLALRAARSLVVPLAVALPPLFWVVEATRRASLTPLGRDQGIFQYVAWAIARGEVDYRDVRDVNGPLTHLVHLALLALGGADEHRFRVLDLAVTGATFAIAGACVPGLRARRTVGLTGILERIGWALAGWVVLSGQYLLYKYWDLAQRESFFDWFLLPSLGLQLVAQAPRRDGGAARQQAGQARLLALAGALGVVTWAGKPTYALFTAAQVFTLLVDDALARSLGRRRALSAFALGGAAGAAVPAAFLAPRGDPVAFLRVQLVDVPAMYRFIWPRAAADILTDPWCASQAAYAACGAAVVLALVALGEMPRRAVLLALAPLAALGSVVVQAKGFPYHFHPVTAAVYLQWVAAAAWLGERTRVASRRRALARAVPVLAGALLALRVATALEDSPYLRPAAAWLLWGARTPEARASRAYFEHFPERDFFPVDLRDAAAFVREHTAPDDRVQLYGMDPYLLFLAERRSATPYLYAYDLDADAALEGGTGGRPDEAQAERIRAMQSAHAEDLLARLVARPPAAFVFIDEAPLLSEADAWADFDEHCPVAAAWVRSRYRERAAFGRDHVWLRDDLVTLRGTPRGGAP
jgi:hypothetical protein